MYVWYVRLNSAHFIPYLLHTLHVLRGLSVCVWHTRESCKNGRNDRESVWPCWLKEPWKHEWSARGVAETPEPIVSRFATQTVVGPKGQTNRVLNGGFRYPRIPRILANNRQEKNTCFCLDVMSILVFCCVSVVRTRRCFCWPLQSVQRRVF